MATADGGGGGGIGVTSAILPVKQEYSSADDNSNDNSSTNSTTSSSCDTSTIRNNANRTQQMGNNEKNCSNETAESLRPSNKSFMKLELLESVSRERILSPVQKKMQKSVNASHLIINLLADQLKSFYVQVIKIGRESESQSGSL